DANFSSFWSEEGTWPRHAIVGLLNSAWARACMEALGTPMGGGALKLEATHLRRLPVPQVTQDEIQRLDQLGKHLSVATASPASILHEVDEIIINAILQTNGSSQEGTR